jgi:predicted metal-dependent hydrolase
MTAELRVGERTVELRLVRHRRARRYILRVGPDGTARVTIPPRGSIAEAQQFVARNLAWLETQFQRQATHPGRPMAWTLGTEILLRGERVRLEAGVEAPTAQVRFGSEILRVTDPTGDLRSAVHRHLWRLAARELPARLLELAAAQQLSVRRVTVRNQRSRWGSCSRSGTISLNWRLVQTPPAVRDYILLHELMHLREMNHSPRFWREVERVCPDHAAARRWLREHGALLH